MYREQLTVENFVYRLLLTLHRHHVSIKVALSDYSGKPGCYLPFISSTSLSAP